MERDGNDISVQFYRWSLVSELCRCASDIAQTALLRGERLDTARVFELAILDILRTQMYSKNDLAEVSAVLVLSARALKNVCSQSEGFMLGATLPPPPISVDYPQD